MAGTNVGSLVLIKVGTKLLVGQTSMSFKMTAQMIETSNKTTGSYASFEYGRINSTLSVSGIASTAKEATNEGFHELKVAMGSKTKVSITVTEYGSEAGTTATTGAETITMTGLVSSLSWDAPDNDKNTFSADFQISGEPASTTNAGS